VDPSEGTEEGFGENYPDCAAWCAPGFSRADEDEECSSSVQASAIHVHGLLEAELEDDADSSMCKRQRLVY
jgi:hypothetical protein